MKSVLILILAGLLSWSRADDDKLDLLLITIATDPTDGYVRFVRSAEKYGYNVRTVGMGLEWKGGDMAHNPGGGHKINLLKPVVAEYKDKKNLLIMFTDSYDVILAASPQSVIEKFLDFKASSVFSAEGFCWPDRSLASQYPKVALGKRFLCSGGFVGYASVIADIIADHEISDTDDDQLYYTKIFLDVAKREKYKMKLDHRSHIFQNLNGASEEVELKFLDNETVAFNSLYDTSAAVYHGNGPSKLFLNSFLSNYIAGVWNQATGCTVCDTVELKEDSQLPELLLAIFVERPTPFLEEFLQKISALNYPTNKMSLWVHCQIPYHNEEISSWVEAVKEKYARVSYVDPSQGVSETDARTQAMQECRDQKCGYYFSVDAIAHLDNPDVVRKLMQLNRTVVAPFMIRPNMLWSNYWGNIASNGFYARSRDYNEIVGYNRLNIWNAPYIGDAMMFSGEWLAANSPVFHSDNFDPDMTWCEWMRDKGHFMYVSNLEEYGHLINPDDYSTDHLHSDFYEIKNNKLDWEKKYIHENYSRVLEDDYEVEQPCPDVYHFPVTSKRFCEELIEEVEHFGQWSGGKHEDGRLAGGYENVPTVDIHMNQIGFEQQWLQFLKDYIGPVQLKVFPGYYTEAHAIMNFVVKYHLQGQTKLRPHHDSSTFTVNMALSMPGVDHSGGGSRFLRYNCSVLDSPSGWSIIHPGRLTHYHEGLPLINGTRYIMVSFVDP
ncbi:multifunctional procollagen lysine hydroxylase and glycosyltransferase LH3-like isoform X2 [Dysidea avara]|uniref:multifunctional procollagen lysine hydroxylase and glycosyltransferase LH3-like isoform X2 n=1 Tax=Dysidea avara TaxID=196820 RepID=UPI00331C253A